MIHLGSGTSVPLGALARVRRGPAEPSSELMRWNGVPAVGLGVVAKDGINAVAFGREVRRTLDELEVVARRLEQGPSLDAPVELRLYGHDLEDLEAADLVKRRPRRARS